MLADRFKTKNWASFAVVPGAVLWDLDGTLVDSEPLHTQATAAALDGLGLRLPPSFDNDLLGVSEEGVHAALVQRVGLSLDRAAWRDLKWSHYEGFLAGLKPRATTLPALQRLAAMGVPMAVVSNSTRREVDLALAATDLAPLFAVTISRNEVSVGKPDPEGYLAAAQRLGVSPSASLVVEDSVTGTLAGLAAGMTTVFHPQHAGTVPKGAIELAPEEALMDLIFG
jgi:HAD superfamily hydrolase (TIGR01509 family)